MSNSFWTGVLAGLKALVANIEAELAKGWNEFLSILGKVITAEENKLMADWTPFVKELAIGLQNTQPGLSGQDFIVALLAIAIPALEKEGVDLLNTAIGIVVSSVAHDLGVGNQAGNAGTVS